LTTGIGIIWIFSGEIGMKRNQVDIINLHENFFGWERVRRTGYGSVRRLGDCMSEFVNTKINMKF
jgi:hypothetical protein